jgi:hypothetical protein
MEVLATLALGALAGGALFWLLLWRRLGRQRAAAVAIVGCVFLLPVADLMLVEPQACDDVACGFLLFAWLWRSVLLAIGAVAGVFASHLSPWGTE